MRTLKSKLKLSVATLALALPATAFAEAPIVVTSNADSGAGSLRAALQTAAASGAPSRIVVSEVGEIALATGLVYGGQDALSINGNGALITSGENVTLFVASEGADLTLTGMTLAGPGGFDINTRGDVDQTAGKGIFVDVRDDQTGTVSLRLLDVTVANVAGHGVHVSDCSLADDCGGGGGGAGEGSPASISVHFDNVTIDGVGQGRFDADGLRVDERSTGSIHFVANGATFIGVGADGAELDEGQDGDVIVTVAASSFVNNGDYCDPALLSAYMPASPEGEFDEGAMAEADIPGPITTSPDDRCFEREVDLYDDGTVEEYEFAIDVDDGFDIDEAGPGSIIATVTGSTISNNFDEGLDFDEEGTGGFDLDVVNVYAENNADESVKASEEDDGNTVARLRRVVTDGDLEFEEEGVGIVDVTINASFVGDDMKLAAENAGPDTTGGFYKARGTTVVDELDIEGDIEIL